MNRLFVHLATVTVGLVCVADCPAAPVFDSSVSVFDSSVLPEAGPPLIVPVGGSGISNGNFAVDTFSGGGVDVQVGLRAIERFVGGLDNAGPVYFAPAGQSPPGEALWNFELHVDTGTTALTGGTPPPFGDPAANTFSDFAIIFEIDTDPTAAVDYTIVTDLSTLIIDPTPGAPGSGDEFSLGGAQLFQSSQNLGFAFIGYPGFDPTLVGAEYNFRLSIIDSDDLAGLGEDALLAGVEITVVTTPEPTAVADVYALVKVLSRTPVTPPIGLVVNCADSMREARSISQRVSSVAARFLSVAIDDFGQILRDENVPAAIRRRRPVVDVAPRCSAARSVAILADRILSGDEGPLPTPGFFRKLFGHFY